MSKIELNHWYIDKNTMSIALLKFHVRINILKNTKFVYYQTIINDEQKELTLNFYSIEDAVIFTEKIISKCKNIKDVIEKYEEKFEKSDFIVSFPEENPLSKKLRGKYER